MSTQSNNQIPTIYQEDGAKIQPIYAEPVNNSTQTTNVSTPNPPASLILVSNMMHSDFNEALQSEIYFRSRLVRILAVIDMLFLILSLTLSIVQKSPFWITFLLFPLCGLGYYGAKTYQSYPLFYYVIYLFIMSINYLVATFYYNSFLLLIVFFIEIYFFCYALRLYNFLRSLNDEQLQSLREGWSPNQTTIYFV